MRSQNSSVWAAKPLFPASRLKRLFGNQQTYPAIAIAVSGGGDSMALLHMVLLWRGSPHEIVALTVDHQLREGSALEAQRVALWCRKLGIRHHTLNWKHEPIKSGIQAKARKARYDLMSGWCAKNKVPVLLTAHTRDDQAETVAMRKLRTSSDKSLSGIQPRLNWNGVSIERPLLGVRRKELRTVLISLKADWLEDPSNMNDTFERVRVRKTKPSMALATAAKAASKRAARNLKAAEVWRSKNLSVSDAGAFEFARKNFLKLSHAIQDDVVSAIIINSGGSETEAGERARLSDWLCSAETGRRTLGGVMFAKRRTEVIAAREPGRIQAKPVTVASEKPVVWDKRFAISAPKGSTITFVGNAKPLKRNKHIPAFVQEGLPVVMKGGKLLAAPTLQSNPSVSFTLVYK